MKQSNSLWQIFLSFFKIGAFPLAGAMPCPLIRMEVLKTVWLEAETTVNFVAVSESTPGPFAVNMAAYVGSEMGAYWESESENRRCLPRRRFFALANAHKVGIIKSNVSWNSYIQRIIHKKEWICMANSHQLFHFFASKRKRSLSPTRIIALAFAGIILLGAVLLTLPAASRSGASCGFRPALFTATSATCVTGLVLYDTWTQWSGFGQIVILSLIEIGGLGFMSAASVFVFFLRKKMGLKQRLIMAQALSLNDMQGVVRLQKIVLAGSLAVEAIGAVVLTLRFWPEFGFSRALRWGVFHSISAFCNAGFDILGCITPGVSLMEFNSDPVVLLTLGFLVVTGGLGFFVWEEIAAKRSFRSFSVYTKLVLIATAVLVFGGAAILCLLEWNNPATLGSMSLGDKLLNGLFQSITLRTAGFAAIDQALLTDAGKGVSMLLMIIGGSSGSTAGGIKTVTMVVLLLFIAARARGRETVSVFKRSIPSDKVMDAMTIAVIMVSFVLFGGIFISATSPVSFTDGLYESVSALATVGVTAGATGSLSVPAQYLMIAYMYFGRVGVLTISLGFLMGNKAEDRFRYAQSNLLIG